MTDQFQPDPGQFEGPALRATDLAVDESDVPAVEVSDLDLPFEQAVVSDELGAEPGPHAVEPSSFVALQSRLDQALAVMHSFTARAEFYETAIKQLQSRVETLQADQIQELLGPVLHRMSLLLTQAADSAARARNAAGPYDASVEFEYFQDLIVESLALINVDSVEATAGEPFDRTRHAARKSVPTGNQTFDGTIAKVLRQGLTRGGAERAFLPAQVSVYRYSADADAPAAAPVTPEITTPTTDDPNPGPTQDNPTGAQGEQS